MMVDILGIVIQSIGSLCVMYVVSFELRDLQRF
jgi:hypothetical protein